MSERQNTWRENSHWLHKWKRSDNTISRKEQRHIRNSQKITKRMSQTSIISCSHFARCRAPFCCVVDERLGTSWPLPNSPAPKLSLALSLRQRVQTHDEPRPPHSCFAKQNLRPKIFTGVGLTKERSVMKYLNHFTSLAC